MVKVVTRINEIEGIEGFRIDVLRKAKVVKTHRQSVMGVYGALKALKGSASVQDWKMGRFRKYYPDLECRVLYGPSWTSPWAEALGQTLLKTVRATY